MPSSIKRPKEGECYATDGGEIAIQSLVPFLAIQGLAIVTVIFATSLDACDGRVDRATGGTSKFGAELDSLSDVVCFGAVPAFVLCS